MQTGPSGGPAVSSNTNIRPIVLAAGAGSRLWPLAQTRPKPMVPVAGRPILAWVLDAVREAGFSEATVVIGYKASTVQSYFQDGRDIGLELTYVRQEQQAGTAHAVATALQEEGMPEAALILGGDNVVDTHLVRALTNAGPDALAVTKSEHPSRYGVVTLRGDEIEEITEKPLVQGDALISTGAVLLSRDDLDALSSMAAAGTTDLPTVLNKLVQSGHPLQACVTTGDWHDAVYPWDLLPITEMLLSSGAPDRPDTADIDPGAQLQGAVLVEAGATVGTGAIVQGPTSLGKNARVSAGAFVRRSLVLDGVKLGPRAVVEDSVIAEGVDIGAGVVIGGGPCRAEAEDGLHKVARLGAIVGEGCRIGPGAVLAPGTVLGNRVTVAPGARVRGRVPDGGWVQ